MPDLLRGLRASDPAVAEQALKDLFASTTHQGTCYPATAPTVRFRAELAAAPAPPTATTSCCWPTPRLAR
jgi:hypothetical protein